MAPTFRIHWLGSTLERNHIVYCQFLFGHTLSLWRPKCYKTRNCPASLVLVLCFHPLATRFPHPLRHSPIRVGLWQMSQLALTQIGYRREAGMSLKIPSWHPALNYPGTVWECPGVGMGAGKQDGKCCGPRQASVWLHTQHYRAAFQQ